MEASTMDIERPSDPSCCDTPVCHEGNLTDLQWSQVSELFSIFNTREERRGRPSCDPRAVLNGVLWKISRNCPWHRLPQCYPVYQTCHRSWMKWYKSGLVLQVLCRLYGSDGERLHRFAEAQMRSAFVSRSERLLDVTND